MMKLKVLLFILVLVVAVIMFFSESVGRNTNFSLKDFENVLDSEKLLYSVTEDVKGGIYDTDSRRFNVKYDFKEEMFFVYEFKNSKIASRSASQLSKDGSTLGGRTYDFYTNPHFYKRGRIIVQYVGNDIKTLDLFNNIFGQQFAGW
jgi:opacity protein-like surface antigen